MSSNKMAKSSQSSKPNSQKTQSSISSFFGPKTTVNGYAAAKAASQLQSQASPPPPASKGKEKEPNLYEAESEEEDEEPKGSKRPRALTEGTNGGNNGLPGRPAKRTKAASSEAEESAPIAAPKATAGKTKITPRTEKYLYSSSAQAPSNDVEIVLEEGDASELAAEQARKEELHQRWLKKMGGVTVGRRSWLQNEESAVITEDGEGEGEEDEEPAPPPTKTKKKGAKTGKLTPLEIQVLDIKRKHMDTLLIIEVGYKFKFFGEDARTAAKELSIVCIPGKFRYDEHHSEAHLDRFASASIPVHRLPVHAKRLVQAGHKIGIVRQIETAALKKAGDNRNAPFVRKLTNVYTKGTYIDDVEGLDTRSGAPATGYLLCITEAKSKGWGTDEKVDVGILAVQPATGDIIYDTFEDGFMRSEIETRLLHLAPCEFLIVGDLTKATDKLVQHLSNSTNVLGDRIRVERVKKTKTMPAEAHSHVTQFYADKLKKSSQSEREQSLLDKVLNLPEEVTICLSAMINHMTEYGLQHVFDLTKYFQSFSARSHMLLNGNTLTSLEIYHNSTDHTERGSLFWTLDKTKTRFGQRLLRKWVGQPLLDVSRLEERVAAVEELKDGQQTLKVDKLESLLRNIRSDLERSLIRIYYGKCTRPELLVTLQTLQKISNEYASEMRDSDHPETGFISPLINNALATLPTIGEVIVAFLDRISAEAARKDDKYAFFHELHETDTITNHKLGIAAVEQDLDAHRSVASTLLKQSKQVVYTTVAGIEYLIEVPNTSLKSVPASWTKISGTKKASRFHTPEVIRMLRERDQHKESLSAACDLAFSSLLQEVGTHYTPLRDTITSLSTLDCLLSLSQIASLPSYTKPLFLPSTPSVPSSIKITQGRHPMIEALLPGTGMYIPNNTDLSTYTTRAQLITGANMGGKSSYVRQIALLALMAQIGSFVPAERMELTPLEAIHTRMGAEDSLFNKQSTFHHELSETSTILSTSTPRSLVILDELGRGTSTHDGVAIAGSVLTHVVEDIKCLCLFITHYQSLASIAEGFKRAGGDGDGEEGGQGGDGGDGEGEKGRGVLENVHMGFTATKKAGLSSPASSDTENIEGQGQEEDKGDEEITFLYEVRPGIAHRSYGLNVARLANIPKPVLEVAAQKSHEMEQETKQKKLASLARMLNGVLLSSTDEKEGGDHLDQLISGIEQL